jgi:TRAP-type C4-dicarboxylate transport system substrate-binding protein
MEAARYEVTLAREDLLSTGRGTWEDLDARGVKVTRLTPDQRQRFVDATRHVYTKWKALVGRDLVEKAEAAVRDDSAIVKPNDISVRK